MAGRLSQFSPKARPLIAEFVEDPAALKLIGDLGIDCAQEYHVGWPAPALAFAGVATDA